MASEPQAGGVTETTVIAAPDFERILTRIAFQIIEANHGTDNLVILGIPSRGAPLAQRIAERIAQHSPGLTAAELVGSLDVTMHRDDLARNITRTVGHTEIPASGIDGKVVVLVDDVLFSGRTIRAALDALSDLGRPAAVRLAVLVDRGHRQLPIRADHVGKNLPTSLAERVKVNVREIDGLDSVTITAVTGGGAA
ncbi:bifunctional pyr operon transcriptional regulator/uracil phosphoribosyltransferase PyrR [Micrococcales bacterium 31B]|nr:bifunctional pyr operon transcriptional regulator/uracil phosphoribosyltransferase PyrR [Micrococcales bacterium 31B]